LIIPAFVLAFWLATGLALAWLVSDFATMIGQGYGTDASRLILALYLGSTALLVWLCWRSHKKSAIRLINHKAVVRTGLLPLFNASAEIDLEQAEVALRETFLGRLFHYGTVSIVGPAGTRSQIRFVPNPQSFYQTLRGVVGGVSPA
jgi:hypothetical protein